MAAGWGVGNPALREFAPRSGACDWPRVAMVARAAFTGTHCSSCGGGGARGGLLVVRIVHVRSGSCLQVSLKSAKDRQKTGVLWMCMCALSFKRHRTISSVIPVEDTRAILPRIPPMM